MDQVTAFLLRSPPTRFTKRPRCSSGRRGGGNHSSSWSERELEGLLAAQESLSTKNRVEFAARITAVFEDHQENRITFSQLVRKTAELAKQIRRSAHERPGKRAKKREVVSSPQPSGWRTSSREVGPDTELKAFYEELDRQTGPGKVEAA